MSSSSWISPNLSQKDLELIISSLDDYVFYVKQDGIEYEDVVKLVLRLNNYLEKYG